jgi:ferrous iron transport protein B
VANSANTRASTQDRSDARTITVAVAGNPNAGKTTIFNQLTGAKQRVGNYPGVTVEWKEGWLRRGDLELKLVDLPGTYSLTAYSEEELVARNYLLTENPDVIVNVVDASNLERNLFLTTELMELGIHLVVVLNMSDAAQDQGLTIDTGLLARRLGAPVIPAVGNKGLGIGNIIEAIAETKAHIANLPGPANICRAAGPSPATLANIDPEHEALVVPFPDHVEKLMPRLEAHLPEVPYQRWLALKVLDADPEALKLVPSPDDRAAIAALVAEFESTAQADRGSGSGGDAAQAEETDTLLARARYEHIGRICSQAVRQTSERKDSLSDRIDRVVMHPVWACPSSWGSCTWSSPSPSPWARRSWISSRAVSPCWATASTACGEPRPPARCARCWSRASSAVWAASSSFCPTSCCSSWPSPCSKARATWRAPPSSWTAS